MDSLKRLKTILKEKNVLIDTDRFIDALAERDLISLPREMELKKIVTYAEKVDDVFFTLFQTNPHITFPGVEEILKRMERGDILSKLQETQGQFIQS